MGYTLQSGVGKSYDHNLVQGVAPRTLVCSYLLSRVYILVKGHVSVYSQLDVSKNKNRDFLFFVFFWARKMETSAQSLCISHILNNDLLLEMMKRGRPAKHPRNAKWYRLELGVGENAKKAYERWHAYLNKFQDCSRATAKVRK